MVTAIELWLIHHSAEMCAAFVSRFDRLPAVRVIQSRYQELPQHDCFVTAGNAFGLMTAGVDAAVIAVHGPDLMRRIQLRIMDEFLGEQPVGTCFLEPTGNRDSRYIAHAPTMRVPGSIAGTDKVYAATWAALVAVYRHNLEQPDAIRTLVLPAMGAGFGSVPYSEVARQMAAAYRHFLEPPTRFDWEWVAQRQKSICYDGSRQVVR